MNYPDKEHAACSGRYRGIIEGHWYALDRLHDWFDKQDDRIDKDELHYLLHSLEPISDRDGKQRDIYNITVQDLVEECYGDDEDEG